MFTTKCKFSSEAKRMKAVSKMHTMSEALVANGGDWNERLIFSFSHTKCCCIHQCALSCFILEVNYSPALVLLIAKTAAQTLAR
jgi:hypothetical protein